MRSSGLLQSWRHVGPVSDFGWTLITWHLSHELLSSLLSVLDHYYHLLSLPPPAPPRSYSPSLPATTTTITWLMPCQLAIIGHGARIPGVLYPAQRHRNEGLTWIVLCWREWVLFIDYMHMYANHLTDLTFQRRYSINYRLRRCFAKGYPYK